MNRFAPSAIRGGAPVPISNDPLRAAALAPDSYRFRLLEAVEASGMQLRFAPALPTRIYVEVGRTVFFHSEPVLAQLLAGVLWHDERPNCATWTDLAECRCDVEAVTR